jgi:hypothetical protein
LLGNPCKQTEMRDNCLMIGPAAQWAMETGAGREITREEMLELLDRADRDGLVLEPENTKSIDRDRCIGRALRLEAVEHPTGPPDDTKALYLKLFQERFGRLGLTQLGARKLLGMKI